MANKTMEGDTVSENAQKSELNEREKSLLTIAVMHCLKSGPPEVDMAKFKEFGNFNTLKTAQNTWWKIRTKLTANCAVTQPADDSNGIPPATSKGKDSPKKRKAAEVKDEDDVGDTETTPARKKAAPKKRSTKAASTKDVDGIKAEQAEDDE